MTTAQPADEASWEEALATLEHSLREASWAVGELRRKLANVKEPVRLARAPAPPPEPDEEPEDEPEEAASAAETEESRTASAFERLWDRIEQERAQNGTDAEEAAAKHGLDLLPQQYLLTVEDREGKVDLVPLHRALLEVQGVQEFSLVSFANGVPVISLRVGGELDPDALTGAVSLAMQRQCELIPQDGGRLFLRLKSMIDRGGRDAG